jgi:hypothetical protein
MMTDAVFVFGSNLAGRHGKGAALHAYKHYGAIPGIGAGPMGNSYAIPTKRTPYESLPLDEITVYAQAFIAYAAEHPETSFQLTAIGCGLAGYKPEDIAPLFRNAPPNVMLPPEFVDALSLRKMGAGR